MEILKKFQRKMAGLSSEQAAQETLLLLKSRFAHHYRYAKNLIINPEITTEKLLQEINLGKTLDILTYFKKRDNIKLYPGFNRLLETSELYKDNFPESEREIISKANDICEHKFAFLGRKLEYKEEIDWSYDPTTDYHWPKIHYSKISTISDKPGTDIKIPWELARLQHFVTLGQAYHLTKNEKYAVEFCSQLLSFAKENPVEIGIHWLCAMEVALRAISLTLAFYFFRSSENFNQEILLTLLKLLFSHANHIENNLEYSLQVTSNHYLSDLIGLLFIGIVFPEFRQSKKWVDFALSELLKEMDKQVYPDGADWESSIGYHALVLEIFLYAFLLCKENKIAIEDRYWNKLEKMFEFVRAYLKPDAKAPLIGDCDSGRVIIWQTRQANDHSYLLPIAAVLFQQENFKLLGSAQEESIWIFGYFGWDTLENLPLTEMPSSVIFPNAGIYLLRDKDLYMVVDVGDIGINGKGSHAHNDLLSFELFYREKTFFVDPGSYVYTSDAKARNLFRSTAFHNTVMVDNTEINEIYPGQLFTLGSQAKPKINRWTSTLEYDFLDVEHNAYERLSQPVIHQRQIQFNKVLACWLITDILRGSGEHLFSFFFNFDENLSVEIIEKTKILIIDETNNLSLILVPLESKGLKTEIVERWVSKGYGEKTKSWGVVYNLKASAPEKRRFLIAPCSSEDISGIDDLIEQIEQWQV
ncbi:MAG: alginate lyase family protein [Acidobacteria bacterium]|nr:alginate lyase family protein [Acidobacteriota bacterium]